MKNLYESIFTTNASAISDKILKGWGYEDKGDYEQAYLNNSYITHAKPHEDGFIIWPKSPKATIHITADMIKYLDHLKNRTIDTSIYICPIGGKKLYDRGDITLQLDKDMDIGGDLTIIWASKGGNLIIKGATYKTLGAIYVTSCDGIKDYPNVSSIFDFINLSGDDRRDCMENTSRNDFNLSIFSNMDVSDICAIGTNNTTVTIYGDIFNLGDSGPDVDMDFGKAKVIDKSNNAVFGL